MGREDHAAFDGIVMHPVHPRQVRIEKACLVCAKVMRVIRSQAGRSYCSKECAKQASSLRYAVGEVPMTVAEIAEIAGCELTAMRKRIYAARLTPGSEVPVRLFGMSKANMERVQRQPRVQLTCERCAVAFEWRAKQGRRFCSRACYLETVTGRAHVLPS